jgi:predicted Zn-dependent protease
MQKRVFIYLGFATLCFFGSCATDSKTQPSSLASLDQSNVDPTQVLIQKLGGPIGYDLEIENYLKRVLLRLSTLTTFREQEISIQIVNQHGSLCLFFDSGKLLLSRGLLVSLSNEAELVSAVTIAMLTKTNIHHATYEEIANLPDELKEADFPQIRAILKNHSTKFDLKRCQEILTSLGYSKNSVLNVLDTNKQMLLGLECQKEIQKNLSSTVEHEPGYIGEATYQKIIQPLKMLQESYDLEQKSIQLFEKNQAGEALSLINQAINENPAEGHFYYTLSKILHAQNLRQQSFKAIEQAIKLNSFNVLFYLQRAKLFEELSQNKEAIEDFQFASDLLLHH